jgi:hypothetical protein
MCCAVWTIHFLADLDFGVTALAIVKLQGTSVTITRQHLVTSLVVEQISTGKLTQRNKRCLNGDVKNGHSPTSIL